MASKATALACTEAAFIPCSTRKASLQRPAPPRGSWWVEKRDEMVVVHREKPMKTYENDWKEVEDVEEEKL